MADVQYPAPGRRRQRVQQATGKAVQGVQPEVGRAVQGAQPAVHVGQGIRAVQPAAG